MRFLVLVLVLTTGCVSANLAPSSIRQKSYTIETKLKKDAAFDKLQSWLAAGGGEVRVNDRTSGVVGMRANVPCKAMKLGNGYAQDERLWFFLELRAENQKVTATFTDLRAEALGGAWDTGARPSNEAEVETAARECLEPLKNSIATKLI